jgi:hypothetical protein
LENLILYTTAECQRRRYYDRFGNACKDARQNVSHSAAKDKYERAKAYSTGFSILRVSREDGEYETFHSIGFHDIYSSGGWLCLRRIHACA